MTSGYSAASSAAGGAGSLVRRMGKLEWDTTADLRADLDVPWVQGDNPILNQREAVKDISNLEQMVIESYSNYFPRGDPEGKPSKKSAATTSGGLTGKIKLLLRFGRCT